MRSVTARSPFDLIRGFPWPRAGESGDAGWFGPGSATWKVNGEMALMLGGGRALLMQLAHPSVAAGVADHSDFHKSPFERLWRTMDMMLTIEFGDSEQAASAARGVTDVHETVRGSLPSGEPYMALDPQLLLWVHATLVDSGLLFYELLIRRLSESERERYYEELKRQAIALRVPREIIPATLGEFSEYVRDVEFSVEVGDQARAMRDELIYPRAPAMLTPYFALQRAMTVATLPPTIREGYGLVCTHAHERVLRAASVLFRSAVPVIPRRLRRWPHASAAERRCA